MSSSVTVGWNETLNRRDNPYGAISAKKYETDSSMLLIDARLMSYASFHTRKLSTSDGTCTSVLHGLIEQIQGLCVAANTRRWLLVWDGVPSYRRRIFKGYKIRQDRERTPEEAQQHRRLVESMNTAIKVGEMLGWPMARLSEVEADDLIGVFSGTAYRQLIKPGKIKRAILVTEDKDYYQLIRSDKVMVYRHRMGEVVDQDALFEMYGLTPQQFIDYKALIGEDEGGDNIPSVNGIGDKTARKLIATHGSIGGLHAHLRKESQIGKGLTRKRDVDLFHGQEITHRAYRLSRILAKPHELLECYPDQSHKLREEWSIAHAQLVRGFRVNRPAYLKDLVAFRGKYEFDSFDPQAWCRTTGFRLGF